MPKRKRTKEQRPAGFTAAPAAAAVVADEATRAARLFAESLRTHEAADRVAQQQAADALERERLHAQLRHDKQAAADTIKGLRASSARGQRLIEAEAAYRTALAELQEFETGQRPHWAPAKRVDEDPLDGDAPEPTA